MEITNKNKRKRGSEPLVWITPKKSPRNSRIEEKEIERPKVSSWQNSRLLREKAGRGAKGPEGIRDPARAELDLVVVEEEERRVSELAISVSREFVAGTVDMQLFPVNEALGMGENHTPNCKRSEAELRIGDNLASPTSGTSAMPHSELGWDEEDVARLLLTEGVEDLGGAGVHLETIRGELALPVVVELPRISDLFENEIHGSAVALGWVGDLREEQLGQSRDRGTGEPSFGAFG